MREHIILLSQKHSVCILLFPPFRLPRTIWEDVHKTSFKVISYGVNAIQLRGDPVAGRTKSRGGQSQARRVSNVNTFLSRDSLQNVKTCQRNVNAISAVAINRMRQFKESFEEIQ